ncbi:MAG: hypothetical protein V7K35_27325 [Nostoc sp.]
MKKLIYGATLTALLGKRSPQPSHLWPQALITIRQKSIYKT